MWRVGPPGCAAASAFAAPLAALAAVRCGTPPRPGCTSQRGPPGWPHSCSTGVRGGSRFRDVDEGADKQPTTALGDCSHCHLDVCRRCLRKGLCLVMPQNPKGCCFNFKQSPYPCLNSNNLLKQPPQKPMHGGQAGHAMPGQFR